VEDQLAGEREVDAAEPDGAVEAQLAGGGLTDEVEDVGGVVLVGEVLEQQLVGGRVDGLDDESVEKVGGAEVLELIGGWLDDLVATGEEAVAGGDVEVEGGAGGDHVEGGIAHDRVEAD